MKKNELKLTGFVNNTLNGRDERLDFHKVPRL